MSQQSTGWRKASYSSGSGNCVEVASASSVMKVRDSKDQSGPVLSFSTADWTAFLNELR